MYNIITSSSAYVYPTTAITAFIIVKYYYI